jgi:hypothetical protein
VFVPKEINAYKEKILFNLSLRKLICSILGIIVAIGTYFLCTKVIGMTMDMASYIIILEAIPLMAIGFIQKNGMPFEKYLALLIRHKIGLNVLPYKPVLIIDTISDLNNERGVKYAWAFKNTATAGGYRQSRRERRRNSKIKEYNFYQVTKKEQKKKRKAAFKACATARQEYRAAKRIIKRAAKKQRSAKNDHRANQIQ